MMSEYSSERRSQVRILSEILGALKKGALIQTHICNRANLSTAQFKRYRDELIEAGHIKQTVDGRYAITEPGKVALTHYLKTIALMDGKGGVAE